MFSFRSSVTFRFAVLWLMALWIMATAPWGRAEEAKFSIKVRVIASAGVTSPSVTVGGSMLTPGDGEKTIEVSLDKEYVVSISGTATPNGSYPPEVTCVIDCGCLSMAYTPTGAIMKGGSGIVHLFRPGNGSSSSHRIQFLSCSDQLCQAIGNMEDASSPDCGCSPSGGGGGGGGGGGPLPPTPNPAADFKFRMGGSASGAPVGNLRYVQNLGPAVVPDPASFEFQPYFDPGVLDFLEVVKVNGIVRQVLSMDGMVHIKEPVNGVIDIEFYSLWDLDDMEDGLYTILSNAEPIVVYRLAAATNSVAGDGLTLTEIRGGQSVTRGIFGAAASGGSLVRSVRPNGNVLETTVASNATLLTRTVDVKEYAVVSSSEVLVSSRRSEYALKPWGMALMSQIEDPSGAALITSYAYYDNATTDGNAYGRQKHVVRPDGSWMKYEYNSQGAVARTFQPWKDLPALPGDATDLNCRLIETLFDADGQPNGSDEFVLGIQVSATRETVDLDDGEEVDSSWISFVTVETARYHGFPATAPVISSQSYLADLSGLGVKRGALYRTVSPDGKAVRYEEKRGDFDLVTGVFTATEMGTFTRRQVTQGSFDSPLGTANRTTRTLTYSDFRGPHRTEEQVYTGTNFETASVTMYEYEEDGRYRLLSTTQDGDVVSSTVYTSETESTTTDASGISTTTITDASGQVISTTKEGIAAGSNHQAQSDITSTSLPSGLMQTMTTSSAGLSLSSTSTQDLAGRSVSEVDELGRTTTTAYTSGGRVVTRTAPGGVTQITTSYLDGKVKSQTGSGVVPEFHEYALDGSANEVHTVYYGTGDNTSPRWTRTVTNGLGQLREEEAPSAGGGTVKTVHDYDEAGRRSKRSTTGLAAQVYEYDAGGYLSREGVDLNANAVLNKLSNEPLVESESYFEKDGLGAWWQVAVRRQYLVDNDDDSTAVEYNKTRLGSGAGAMQLHIGTSGITRTQTSVVNPTLKTVTTTSSSSISNVAAVAVQVNGVLVSQSTLTVAEPVLFEYDALGRQTKRIDPRTGAATESGYNLVGQVISSANGEGDTTTYTYYPATHASAGQVSTVTNGEGQVTRYDYDLGGRLAHQWGSAVYPLAYEYNVYGQMVGLKTYRAAGDWNSTTLPTAFGTATPSATVWAYHPGSGALTSKTDAASKAVTYEYYPSGLLETRTWARGTVTTYGYDGASRLTSVDYSDTTPDVSHSYRRDGQLISTTDAAGAHAFGYAPESSILASEQVTGAGWLTGLMLTWDQDAFSRREGFTATYQGQIAQSIGYTYDDSSRLNTVASGNHSAAYARHADSDLLHTLQLRQNGTLRQKATRLYDDADRLTSIAWSNSNESLRSSHAYLYDLASRRTRTTMYGGDYWVHDYNDKGEVASSSKKTSLGASLPGMQLSYGFDQIGNRTASEVDAEGGSSRTTGYTTNALNQYTGITNPTSFDVTGFAVNSTVKVNGQSIGAPNGYFRKELAAGNASGPSWVPIELELTLPGRGISGVDIVTTRSGHHFVPPAAEVPVHDDDGNLVADGRWDYTWDGENRLISMQTNTVAANAGVPRRKLDFGYDATGRRVSKRVHHWDPLASGGAGAWAEMEDRRFIYDGWNLLAEGCMTSGVFHQTQAYAWGLDLSLTLSGAGGVGGLLWVDHIEENATHFVAHDGNGNVTAVYDASQPANHRLASFEYGAFGEPVLTEGDVLAKTLAFRFSTKYTDVETGLVYYGYRYYDAVRGRWLSRDPIEEEGGGKPIWHVAK